MQPVGMRLGTSAAANCDQQTGDLLRLTFDYGTTDNNGNMLSQGIYRTSVGFSLAQGYTYDGLNRLRSITEGSGAQTYVYDRYGNRAVRSDSYIPIAAQTPVVSSDTEAAVTAIFPSNRWWDGTPGTLNYDAAGNQTLRFGGSFVYDAENRVTSSTVGTVTTTYAYDGEGRRVKKDAVVMVYDAFGKLAAEYGGTSTGAGRQYLTADHLGSTRLVTNSTGGDMKCSDYLPFGEEISQGVNSRGTCYATFTDPRQKFTGKERDSETGLDYFGARYLSSAQGRFTSPDAPFADQHAQDPQSWNLYAYVTNNPLKFVDVDGLEKRLTIYVDQPGRGGSRGAIDGSKSPLNPDVGHAFLGLIDTDTGSDQRFGLYPKPGQLDVLGGVLTAEGDIRVNSRHAWDVSREYTITDAQYDQLVTDISKDRRSPPDYDLTKNNCTDWVIKKAGTAGVKLPRTTGEFKYARRSLGRGANPGDLGEDLRKLNNGQATNQKPKPPKPVKPLKTEGEGQP